MTVGPSPEVRRLDDSGGLPAKLVNVPLDGSSDINSATCGVTQGPANLCEGGFPLLRGCLCGVAMVDRGAAGVLFAAAPGVGCGAVLAGGGAGPTDVGEAPAEEGDR